ncbi:MAG TPA: DUF4190 domain-containing protein [Jatrophihabitans sp.]|nr:DUF4190 domain-containing protein [Jatrophihabitans sp.]
MNSPTDPRSGEPDEPVSLQKDLHNEQPAEAPFDPYRFGLPETPPPPEYAPPGWTPPPTSTWAGSPAAPPPGTAWAPPYPGGPPPYAGGPGQAPYAGGPPRHPYPGGPAHPPYPPYPYGTSPYQTRSRSNGKAVAALVLGLLTIFLFWTSVFDALFAILAVVFGILALNEANRSGGTGKGMAIAGLVCAAVGAVLAIVVTTVLIHAVNQCGGLNRSNQPGFQQCVQQHLTGSLQ